MSYSSNAVKRLQYLYKVIFMRMKFKEWLFEHGLFGRIRNASRYVFALEQLESRVLLSGTIPTDDLVMHWAMDSIVAGKMEDTSGYGDADGTVVGDISIVTDGDRGLVAYFDGMADQIYAPDLSSLNQSITNVTQKTISLWFKAVDYSPKQILFDGGDSTQGFNIYI